MMGYAKGFTGCFGVFIEGVRRVSQEFLGLEVSDLKPGGIIRRFWDKTLGSRNLRNDGIFFHLPCTVQRTGPNCGPQNYPQTCSKSPRPRSVLRSPVNLFLACAVYYAPVGNPSRHPKLSP